MAAAGFLSRYVSGTLTCNIFTPYNRKYNVLSSLLNKIFPSFLLFASMRRRNMDCVAAHGGHTRC